VLPVFVLTGCGTRRTPSTLRAHSHPARDIESLWWWMLGFAAVGFGVVVLILFVAWLRRRRASGSERLGWRTVVIGGIIVPIGLLSTLFVVANILVIRTTQAPAATQTKLTILVIARQWFWEVRYPGTGAVTANEIHIPARTPVNLKVRAADVIHSFWVPQLNRKIDAIPGQTNRILLYADEPGTYRGNCAEFCGLQHARMGILVIAEPRQRFRRWLAAERRPARAPSGGAAAQGARIFQRQSCSDCHEIRGTPARSRVGPDLTHLASRRTLGSVTIENTRSNLSEWIRESQHVKPGNQMPNIELPGDRLRALVTYLNSLK
jgi:cytochrome c oxidase subunit 2